MTCHLVRDAPPSSSSRREEEERRARCRRRRGFGANEDGPVLLQDSLVLCGKHGIGLVQTRMPSASLSAAAPLARTLPVTSSIFSYLLLPRSALPGPQGPTKERIQTKKGHPSGCPFWRLRIHRSLPWDWSREKSLFRGGKRNSTMKKLNTQWRMSKGMPVTHQEKASCQPPRKK